jgi:hypothetical protein
MLIKRIISSLAVVLAFSFEFYSIFAQNTQDGVDLTPPTLGEFDPDSIADIDPADYPILSTLTDHTRAIFERGQELERNPRMFSKVGDSMTASDYFLVPIGSGDYALGEYDELESAIQFFLAEDLETNAFNRRNYATELGFTTPSALDSTWADPNDCEANESPLTCEYRLSNSAFALIMLGTNDVMFFEADQFDYLMRRIVLQTIDTGVVPVLYTMPIRPEQPERSWEYNRVILKIAEDYDIPVINLVMALERLPNYGVDLNDTLHLTTPDAPGSVTTFDEASLEAGYTIRNLVTLQALHGLLTELDLLDELDAEE